MTVSNHPSVEVQLAVLDSKLDGIQNTLNVRLQSMDDRIATKTDKVQSDERHASISARIGKIEGGQTWIGRIVIGAVVIAILGSGYLANQFGHTPSAAVAKTQ